MNTQKSVLCPSQSIMYLGVQLDSVSMRVHLGQEHIWDLLSALNPFSLGRSVTLKEFQRLLGRMAAATTVCHLGLLFMCPLHVHVQLWLKAQVPSSAWKMGRADVLVTRRCLDALKP